MTTHLTQPRLLHPTPEYDVDMSLPPTHELNPPHPTSPDLTPSHFISPHEGWVSNLLYLAAFRQH